VTGQRVPRDYRGNYRGNVEKVAVSAIPRQRFTAVAFLPSYDRRYQRQIVYKWSWYTNVIIIDVFLKVGTIKQPVDGQDWIGLSSVLRLHEHSIGYTGDGFTGQKTQPTVSKY